MKVSIVAYTPYPVDVCAEAAAICTNSTRPAMALKGALACGHESVIEHASITFRIAGVSRVLLAQFTRHRLASFSVQSQRYCRVADGASVVVPPSIASRPGAAEMYERETRGALDTYFAMVTSYGIPEEDARYVLPQGITTDLVVTMNARELRHFFALRCCNRAQWEIREMARRMMLECVKVAPELFGDAGPGCVRGRCPEGKKCCGKPWNKGQTEKNAFCINICHA